MRRRLNEPRRPQAPNHDQGVSDGPPKNGDKPLSRASTSCVRPHNRAGEHRWEHSALLLQVRVYRRRQQAARLFPRPRATFLRGAGFRACLIEKKTAAGSLPNLLFPGSPRRAASQPASTARSLGASAPPPIPSVPSASFRNGSLLGIESQNARARGKLPALQVFHRAHHAA